MQSPVPCLGSSHCSWLWVWVDVWPWWMCELGCRERTAQHCSHCQLLTWQRRCAGNARPQWKVPGLHIPEPIPSPGRHKGLWHVQSKAGWFFSVHGLHSQHVSESGLIWGRWRMVLSTGDVKTSTPSDWIAPLQQVPWAEPLSLCHNLSTSSTPKFRFQLCDWSGYKWKCLTLHLTSEKASLLWGWWDPGMGCREGGWFLSWEIPKPDWWWSWATCSGWCPWVEVMTFYWKSHMWQFFSPSHLQICLSHFWKQYWELPQLQGSPSKSSVFLALEDTPYQTNDEISCAEPESSQML